MTQINAATRLLLVSYRRKPPADDELINAFHEYFNLFLHIVLTVETEHIFQQSMFLHVRHT
jgi:hypothetical protein